MSFLYGGVSFSISLNLILAPVPYATPKRPIVRATAPRSSTWIVLNCILFVIVRDFCCVSIGDLTRDCLVFLKDRQVSRFGCFVFEFWVLRFRDLGASFSSLGCFVFESWVLRASCFVLRFRVLRFRNYRLWIPWAEFQIPPATISLIPEPGLSYIGRNDLKRIFFVKSSHSC